MTLKKAAEKVRAAGRGEDTMLVHLTPKEVGGLQGLAQAAGGSLTVNPKTGLPEAGFLDSLLPTILGVGATMIGGPMAGAAVGALTGGIQAKNNNQDVLLGAALGGLGGYGGGNIAQGLQSAGMNAAQQTAMSGAKGALAQQAAVDGVMGGSGLMGAATPSAGFFGQNVLGQLGQGAQAAFKDPKMFVQGMGGLMPTAKMAGMAAAPMLYNSMMPQAGGDDNGSGETLPDYDYSAELTGDYYQPGEGTYERQYFTTPTFTRRAAGGIVGMAEGGDVVPQYTFNPDNQQYTRVPTAAPTMAAAAPAASMPRGRGRMGDRTYTQSPAAQRFMQGIAGGLQRRARGMAEGGQVGLQQSDFIVPADVVAYAGGGSSNAGLAALNKTVGAEPIRGPGTGLSDSIPAKIDGRQPARVADSEARVPAARVAALGKGDVKKGTKKLYAMLDDVRRQAVGTTKQVRPVNLKKALA